MSRIQRNRAYAISKPLEACQHFDLALRRGLRPADRSSPDDSSSGSPGLDEYRASRLAIYTDDFGELKRYRDADAALTAPKPNENRVVFIGDSITDYWKLADSFPGKPYINRGIDGQTTPQMLVRFRQDVINLHPAVLVVLAGTNDVAGVTGPARNEDIEANYASMAELARLHHIRVVFASLLPVNNYTEDAKESFCASSSRKNSGVECMAQRLLRSERPRISGLLLRDDR